MTHFDLWPLSKVIGWIFVSYKMTEHFEKSCFQFFHVVNLFDPCDPYMTFEVKLLITFVATCLLVILKHVGGVAFSMKMTFLTSVTPNDLWGQTVDNFCSHSPTGHSDQVWSKSDQACGRRSKLWARKRRKKEIARKK